MPIFTHAQENHIQHRLPFPASPFAALQILLTASDSARDSISSPLNPVNLTFRNFQWFQQKCFGHSIIALRIIRRHATFIRPKKVNTRKRNWFLLVLPDNFMEKCLRNPTSGKRNRVSSPNFFRPIHPASVVATSCANAASFGNETVRRP